MRVRHVGIGERQHRLTQVEVVEAEVEIRARDDDLAERLLDGVEGDQSQLVPERGRAREIGGRHAELLEVAARGGRLRRKWRRRERARLDEQQHLARRVGKSRPR